ncbi:MAG TPA: XdhC family protein [Motilibacterales bacterium]|nr:XdhC family protein [Motilibacterales bacterium]
MAEVDVWRALARTLDAGTPCALLAVVDSRGSSPGRRGAVMAVGPDGPLAGTIGGGVGESDLVDRVLDELRSGRVDPRRVLLAHREGVIDSSGMICGGSHVVAVSPLGVADRAGVAMLVDVLSAGRSVEWSIDPLGWRIVDAGGGAPAAAQEWSARVRSGPTHVVHVVGAGHVGSVLAPLLVGLDFRVVLLDERPGPLAAVVEEAAHERVAVPYEDLAGVVPEGPMSFAAIMTHALERDVVALAALEPLHLGYLGILGSHAKVRRIIGDRETPAWFHAPMGVVIGSTTPLEIAVSIAAQMVAVRSGSRARIP